MDSHIKYTHELISYNKKMYIQGQRNVKKRIQCEFESIDSIEHLLLGDGTNAIIVSGPVHLYGYKVENGGFFDVLHTRYYPEYYEFVKNAEIIECKGQHIRKHTIKNV